MKRIYLYFVVLLGIFVLNASPALAQEDYAISGTVLDEYEKPLPGATVRAIGLDKAVTTDKDGKYQIVVPKNTKLEVSFVGFVTKTTNGGRVKLKATTTSVGGVEVVSKKKQDLKKVKFVDPKAMISAVDTLLKRMPTLPIVAPYDTAVVHAYIKNEVYERFKQNAEVMTGVANAYYRFEANWGTHRRKNSAGVEYSLPDTFLITKEICADSVYAYRYIDYAIAADSTYGKVYALAGNIQKALGSYLEAIKWYNRGMKASPKCPDNYLCFAKHVFRNDTASALRSMRGLAKADSLYPVDLEIARMYYGIEELGRSFNFYDKTFWNDTIMRTHFTINDFEHYCASWLATYNIDKKLTPALKKYHDRRNFEVASYALMKYPENLPLIRSVFYSLQRLGVNDTAQVYAEKLFGMPNAKLHTEDYLTYARLYSSMGDWTSADKKYNEAYERCLVQIDETFKEHKDNEESKAKTASLNKRLENLKNNEKAIIKEHTRLYVDDYDKKISIVQYYIDRKKSFGQDYADELNQLGSAMSIKAESVDSSKMVNAWEQVDKVYSELAVAFPDRFSASLLNRIITAAKIDELKRKEMDKDDAEIYFCGIGLAEHGVETLMNKFPLSESDVKALTTAYKYLIPYYFELWVRDKRNKRSKYAVKLKDLAGELLVYEPSNSMALQVLGMF